MRNSYPKVLFITPCAFNKITGGGVTFSNLFLNWPKEKLATVTGDAVPVSRDVCRKYFFLTQKELKYIKPFSFLSSYRRQRIQNIQMACENHLAISSPSISRFIRKLIGEAGVPDSGTLSKALKAWIADFRPDLLYTILGSPGYIDLVLKTQAEFDLPLVIHLMDDGVTEPRRRGLFGSYLRLLYRGKFQKILSRTHLAIAICEVMACEYSRRYGVPFVHFQNNLDLEKWGTLIKKDLKISERARIVYVGAILKDAQQQSLLDCCQAVKKLNEESLLVHLEIFTPRQLFLGDFSMFEICPEIKVHDIPEKDEEYFSLLGKADVLLLPVNFDPASIHYVRFSMPTKVPSYLMSGTPILVYGPAGVAQVEYARKYGWGTVVDRRNIDALANALRRILEDLDLRQKLSKKAKKVAKENHDAKKVTAAFQEALCKAAGEKRITG